MTQTATCTVCKSEILPFARTCPDCGSEVLAPGKVPSPWATGSAGGPTPENYIGIGLGIGIAVGVIAGLVGLDSSAGVIVLIIGSLIAQILILIGVIAKGVQIGIRSVPK